MNRGINKKWSAANRKYAQRIIWTEGEWARAIGIPTSREIIQKQQKRMLIIERKWEKFENETKWKIISMRFILKWMVCFESRVFGLRNTASNGSAFVFGFAFVWFFFLLFSARVKELARRPVKKKSTHSNNHRSLILFSH